MTFISSWNSLFIHILICTLTFNILVDLFNPIYNIINTKRSYILFIFYQFARQHFLFTMLFIYDFYSSFSGMTKTWLPNSHPFSSILVLPPLILSQLLPLYNSIYTLRVWYNYHFPFILVILLCNNPNFFLFLSNFR